MSPPWMIKPYESLGCSRRDICTAEESLLGYVLPMQCTHDKRDVWEAQGLLPGLSGQHRDCCPGYMGGTEIAARAVWPLGSAQTARYKALKDAQPGEGSWQLGTNKGAKVGTFKYTSFWGSFLEIFRHPLGEPLRVVVGG